MLLFTAPTIPEAQQRVTVQDSSLVGAAWAGHPVDFAMLAHGDSVFAAWYHGNTRQMTVAVKAPGQAWRSKTLTGAAATVAWDSHNSITMVMDAQGLLHIAGNMHNNPLRYWRSETPGEIDGLTQVAAMTGSNENSVTYPVFITSRNGDLSFIYRDGGSGSGNHLINRWNPDTRTWSRLLGTNLFSGASGSGTRSVYFGDNDAGPVAGPDGWYHLFWFWRATSDAATTHRVSYMKSMNLTSWFTAAGTAVTLPVSFDNNPGVIVDDVPQFAGLINRGQIGFDAQNRPIISYHKHDSTVAGGYTQAYNARLENGAWVIRKTTSWPHRWNFGGQGSLVIRIQLGPVTLQPLQVLSDEYWPKALDTAYRVANTTTSGNPLPMQVNWLGVRSPKNASVVHALRWETWPENADQPRAALPPAGELEYYRMADPNVVSILPRALTGPIRSGIAAPRRPLTLVDGVVRVGESAAESDLKGRRILPR